MSESKQTYYEKLVYEALMTRELVTYDRVMAKMKRLRQYLIERRIAAFQFTLIIIF